jgi:serine/threonine-protein kinase RsbW/stage II sporulation protein AB (anti-sigma F factor)
MHAYPNGKPGAMQVSATMVSDELSVAVRDWGRGIRPRPDSPGLGLGLSLIAALADTVQLGHDTAEHTEVRMTFLLSEDESAASEGEPVGREVAPAGIAATRPDAAQSADDSRT